MLANDAFRFLLELQGKGAAGRNGKRGTKTLERDL